MVLRCIHGHRFESHPACFAQGLVVLPKEAKEIKIKKDKVIIEPWWADPEFKIGYFDIEVDNLYGNYGICLTWVIKEKDIEYKDGKIVKGKIYKGVIHKKELLGEELDRRVVKEFIDTLRQFKIIIGYYSKRFDMPFMRTRALYHCFDFPEFGEIYHFDLYYTVRNKLALNRNTLENATKLLGIEGKNHVEPEVWQRARSGDKKALEYVLDHNIRDVVILEKLHNRLYPFSKWTRTSI